MEDEYDMILKNKYSLLFNYKIYFLPSTLFFPLLLLINTYRNYIYIFFSTFTSLIILTWNFPFFSKVLYSRPIYFDDLDNNNNIIDNNNNINSNNILYNIEKSEKFKLKFIIFQQILTSVMISFMADYLQSKVESGNYTKVELFGVVGGIISLGFKTITIIGKLYLYYIYKKSHQTE